MKCAVDPETANERELSLVATDKARHIAVVGGGPAGMEVARRLSLRGHRVTLLCPPGSRSESEAAERGIPVHAIRMRNGLDLPAVARLARWLRRERPDLVHLHTGRAVWLGALAARLAGVAALATRRMDRPLSRGPRNARMTHRRMSASLRRCGYPSGGWSTTTVNAGTSVRPAAGDAASGGCVRRSATSLAAL